MLSFVGVLGLLIFFRGLTTTSKLFTGSIARLKMGMIAFGGVGASLLFDAVKKRYFFEVQGPKGVRRLVFSKKATLAEIRTFCADIQTEFPLPITEDLAPTTNAAAPAIGG